MLFLLHIVLVVLLLMSTCFPVYASVREPDLPFVDTLIAAFLSVLLIYLAFLLPDPDTPYSPARPNFQVWIFSTFCELGCLFAFTFAPWHEWRRCAVYLVWAKALGLARLVVLCTMCTIFVVTLPSRKKFNSTESSCSEDETLLPEEQRQAGYGTVPANGGPNDAQSLSAFHYLAGFRRLLPYLWPSHSKSLRARAIFCLGLLVAQRWVNILVPHQLGVVVSKLGVGKLPLRDILVYAVYRGLQGQQGLIGAFRAVLWVPISQSAYRRLTVAAFEHVMNLSLEFHLSKRMGEVLSALSKGSAINTFLDGLLFTLFPMVFDLWVAAAYFFIKFDALYAIIVAAVTYLYLFVTIYMAKRRGRARREAVTRDREMEAAKTDAIMAYETVHHNSAMRSEMSRFQYLAETYQAADYAVQLSLNILNGAQNLVFVIGVLLMCLLSAFDISMGHYQVATFVTVLSYLAQLQAPLGFFGSFYTMVQNNMVDAERMLSLFKIPSSIKDSPYAKPLQECRGKIEFSHVNFAYDKRRPALSDVSFEVEPGTSTAVVGESGSGKSTIIRLLYRFYDIDSGSIRIDGEDLKDVTIESLRSHFGIVPQDTILFNETVMYNVTYSKPAASADEVYDACKTASIHERIMSFPDGYNAKVGERGLRLSGGEKQRISVARAVLKRPRILLLDEATASLDTQTEREIQESLSLVSKGRTTITIAHRLSTITNADQIIVMHRGRIEERGTHQELLARKGRYYAMWQNQTKASEQRS